MARKQIRVSRRMLFTWLMLAGFILLFSPGSVTNKFPFAFTRIFRWPLSISRNFALSAPAQQTLEDTPNRREDQYQKAIDNYKKTLKQEREKFNKILGQYNGSVWKGAEFALADVIAPNNSGPLNRLAIDCRNKTGLVKGHYVLADNCIIGKISDVSSHTALVQLFTDPSSKIEVQIGDLDVQRVMQGNGDNTAKVMLYPATYKVKKGDKVFACRMPGWIDAPIIIGKVTECKQDKKEPLLWDITVKPVCDIKQISEVYIVIMNPQK